MNFFNFKKIRESVNARFSSKMQKIVRDNIKDTEQRLKIINELYSLYNDNWILWYKNSLEERIKYYKFVRFIPARLYFKINQNKNILSQITKNGKYVLKDIVLSFDSQYSDYVWVLIWDCISTYLLEDIKLNEDDYYKILSTSIEGPYEYKEVKLKKNDIVIDAGANFGIFSALAGVKGCKAYAFEPIQETIDIGLAHTSKLNPNIQICKYALSDKKGMLTFSGDSFVDEMIKIKDYGNREKIKVQTIDLDTFVEENNLPRVDFIKADIEGAERYMLMGAKRVLKEFAPKIAICTYHLPDDPQVLRELILDANPNYIIEERWRKMYAYVPK